MDNLFASQVGQDILTLISEYLSVQDKVRLQRLSHDARLTMSAYLQIQYVDQPIYTYSKGHKILAVSARPRNKLSAKCNIGNRRDYYIRDKLATRYYEDLPYIYLDNPIYVQSQPSITVLTDSNRGDIESTWYEYYILVISGKITRYTKLHIIDSESDQYEYRVFELRYPQDPSEFISRIILRWENAQRELFEHRSVSFAWDGLTLEGIRDNILEIITSAY